jgi:hypothetical protein
MNDYQLSKKEIKQIKWQHRKAKTKWETDKLKVIYLLGEGFESKIVAHMLNRDECTNLIYFQHYKDGGSDRLLQNNYNDKEDTYLPNKRKNYPYMYVIIFIQAALTSFIMSRQLSK